MTDAAPPKNPLNALDLQDKMTAIGAAVLALLLFFPWYSIEVPRVMGMELAGGSIKWVSAWQGKFALLCAALAALWLLVPGLKAALAPKVPPNIRPLVPLILSAAAFLFGPLWFFMDAPEGASGAGAQAGKTFWFFLAFLAGADALAGAVWKMMEAQKKPGA